MTPGTNRTRILTAAAVLTFAVATAHAKATPTQKCAAAKNKTAGKYAACLETATANFVTKADAAAYATARAKCRTTFLKAWATADAKAAKAGVTCSDAPLSVDAFDEVIDTHELHVRRALAGDGLERCGDGVRTGTEDCDRDDLGTETCATLGFALGALRCGSGCDVDTSGCFATRFVDNGDGTVTDNQTKLQWEQKTTAVGSGLNFADPHDVDNAFAWSTGGLNPLPGGPLFTVFLLSLNGVSADGLAVTGCFAGHCDWRIPTVAELRAIVDENVCTNAGGACIDPIFGPTVANLYWSSTTTNVPADTNGWGVFFDSGNDVSLTFPKSLPLSARAVRDGP